MEEPAIRQVADQDRTELEMSLSDGGSDEEMPLSLPAEGSIRKGCDPLAQTQRSKLQHRRARINQQINKEMRMRAGAENLFRATTNNKVKETVALELSFVNSNLQLLKEELEELNSNMEVYQTDSEAINVPMIPLGLKETKEVDFTLSIQDFICEHYAEDSALYQQEIKELMELRQAMRTPSRNQAGLELLMEYYNQLYYLDQRFFPLHRTLGVHFHWYDSLTGVPSCQRTLAFEKGSVLFNIAALYTQIGARVPSCQRTLAFEKGSVLFNIAALYTQIGARQDRSSTAGIDTAIDAFQRAAGAFNYLKENFSNAPSLDMSSPSLSMLVRLMVAQVQECVFERVTMTTAPHTHSHSHTHTHSTEQEQEQESVCEKETHTQTLTPEPHTHFTTQLRLAQEAARVSDVYSLVQQTMSQPLMKDYVPLSWATMVQVKAEYFRALAHYHAAVALCDDITVCGDEEEGEDEDAQKAFLQLYISVPVGPPLTQVLRDPEMRRKLGKAHLRRAVIRHEEAMRVHSLCRILRKMDILQDVLSLTHRRSLHKYSELDREDDFDETAEAPEIQSLTLQKPDITPTNFSTVHVTDIFQRLGPLSVFCARARWGPVHVIGLQRREGGLGLTLRGDSPVLVAGVVPGGCAAEAGLREGDYIVAVGGQDCKWAKHSEVVSLLKSCGDRLELSVVTLHSHDTQVERRAIMLSHDKENARHHHLLAGGGGAKEHLLAGGGGAKGQSSASLLNWNRKKKNSSVAKRLGSTFSLSFGNIRDTEAMY